MKKIFNRHKVRAFLFSYTPKDRPLVDIVFPLFYKGNVS